MGETLFDKTRGIKGGKTFFAYCHHGKNTIKNYEPFEHCDLCDGPREKAFNTPNTTPFFNHGLGCTTYGTRDAERIAKKRGLTPIGDTDFRTVAKSVWPTHPLTRSLK